MVPTARYFPHPHLRVSCAAEENVGEGMPPQPQDVPQLEAPGLGVPRISEDLSIGNKFTISFLRGGKVNTVTHAIKGSVSPN